MKQVFLVFCEGETETNYIDFIRREYHSPIKIVSKTEGNRISQQLILRHQNELKNSKNDVIQTFLMYDLDVKSVNKKLKSCNAVWLCSNPCIELWFLLHCKNQTAEITTVHCLNELKRSNKCWHDYQKSFLTESQKSVLRENLTMAIQRAKRLPENQNPSSTVYRLLEWIISSEM
ncbi:MAG: RloB domain-containing protein [Bacteroidales bacterium]|nr:RloB domain-containing protein [Bacteroidales bacterium]